jgi:hypothetical protein
MASDSIEKAKIAKLLILADRGTLDKYKGKKLDDIKFDELPVQYDGSDTDDGDDNKSNDTSTNTQFDEERVLLESPRQESSTAHLSDPDWSPIDSQQNSSDGENR